MYRFIKTTVFLTALASATSAMAQTTTEQPAPSVKVEGVAGELSLGEEAKPRVGETYFKEEFGDWKMRCIIVEQGDEPCQLYQLLLDTQANPVAEAILFPLPKDAPAVAGMTITTPLETLLTEQLTLQIDSSAARRYPFSWCSRGGCFVRLGLTTEDIAAFKKGSVGKVSIVPVQAQNQTVDVIVSLKGFTAAYDAIVAATPAQ